MLETSPLSKPTAGGTERSQLHEDWGSGLAL